MKKIRCGLIFILSLTSAPPFLFAQALYLDYSTYLGGTAEDAALAIDVSSPGEAYICGETGSYDFPTRNAYQSSYGGGYYPYGDAFIGKLSSGGSLLIFSTYLGGSDQDSARGISVESGEAFVCGYTYSNDFPTLNPFQPAPGGGDWDAFVCRLSSGGSLLLYSTYLGGDENDAGNSIFARNGEAYACGYTGSADFPTKNPYQPRYANYGDAFVSRFSTSGSALIYSTYLGGGRTDSGEGIAVENGEIYLCGSTTSENFPVANPYQSSLKGSSDVFLARFSSAGSTLIYSTFLGGSGEEVESDLAVGNGILFVSGWTDSSYDFPLSNPYQATYGGPDSDAFASALSTSGSSLLYSTYLGGHDDDVGLDIAAENGSAYLSGWTNSIDFPTKNPYQNHKYLAIPEPVDAFISRLSTSGSSLIFSTYLGGNENDYAEGISVRNSIAYACGYTESTDFPVANPYQSSLNGDFEPRDAFIGKLVFIPAPCIIDSGDYNGDGASDIAVFRPGSGLWSVKGITRLYFGSSSDIPAPADYNGDGTTEIGVFRGSSSLWSIRGVSKFYFGSSSDQPVASDYAGNGTAAAGLFRPSNVLWNVRGVTRLYFGLASDLPVPGDYNGDGRRDIGTFRRGSGLWAVRDITRLYLGSSQDLPVAGDYDGNGTWEAGIFRPASGLWSIQGVTRTYFGSGFDQPVPGDYDGNFKDDIGTFRDASGLWSVRLVTRVYHGASGDIPVTR